MKKMLLTLATALAFTSAVANTNTKNIEPKVMAADTTDTFVLQKAPLNLNTLNIDNVVIAGGPSCSQTCFNTFRACLAAGLSGCNFRFIRCIDTCEGAGDLYN